MQQRERVREAVEHRRLHADDAAGIGHQPHLEVVSPALGHSHLVTDQRRWPGREWREAAALVPAQRADALARAGRLHEA
eukprot:scaffold10351_cov62-Phaeocystis_antarctica.AAC.5